MGSSYSSKERQKVRKRKWLTRRNYESKVECGDLILVRRYEDKPYGLTHPGISRGMVSHIKGHFDTDLSVHLDPWTSVGIVYRTRSDRDLRRAQGVHRGAKRRQKVDVNKNIDNGGANRHEPNIIIVDNLGVQLWTYSAFLRNAKEKHYIVACRSLEISEENNLDFTELDELYRKLLPVGTSWLSMRNMTYPHESVKVAVRNASLQAKRMPMSMQQELKRYFLSLDSDNNGYIDRHEVKKLLQRLHGDDISENKVKILMNAIDVNHDGVITFDEFLIGFSMKPFKSIAAEHDFCGVTSAELVADVYERMGLLTKRLLIEKEYKPVSFSSSAALHLSNGSTLNKEYYIEYSNASGAKGEEATIDF